MTSVTFKYPCDIQAMDKRTGLKGTIDSRLQRLNGCVQYAIQPRIKEGEVVTPDGVYTDEANIVDLEGNPVPIVIETHEFQYETGDRVRSQITGAQGIITIRCLDVNGCERYVFINKDLDKDGKEISYWCFPQELKLIDKGLNAKPDEPVKRARTGCVGMPVPTMRGK